MIKMMVTVVFVYTLCWLPYNVMMIISDELSEKVLNWIYFPLHGLAMSHACYNPIIYCYMNSRFKEGLFVVMRTIPCLRTCYKRKSRGSSSSAFVNTGKFVEIGSIGREQDPT